ncbi:MAG: type II toxin-antitoxin system HigB family toxin [Cyclobacteriaceae bacterium]
MRIIAKRTLREFWQQHADVQPALEEWHLNTEKADWRTPNDITRTVPQARSLGQDRFSFKIKGNQYRLIVKVNFAYQVVYIRFVGTHAQYDKIDANTI